MTKNEKNDETDIQVLIEDKYCFMARKHVPYNITQHNGTKTYICSHCSRVFKTVRDDDLEVTELQKNDYMLNAGSVVLDVKQPKSKHKWKRNTLFIGGRNEKRTGTT